MAIMAGEMSRDEVTRESYPDLFALKDELSARGIASEPRPFDQYQGPYLYVPESDVRVWYDSENVSGDSFLIERGGGFMPNSFETVGADILRPERDGDLEHGIYYTDSAADRIAAISKRSGKGR